MSKTESVKIGKKIFILFYFLSVLSISAMAHPFYVSICQIDYNKTTHSLEVSVKTFADDLILGLENAGASKIFLGEEKENPKTDTFIFNYLKSNLKLKVNGQSVDFSIIGKEMETDVVWTYLEVDGISELSTIEVECTILIEVFDTQSNIIQINDGNGIQNLLLNKRKTSDILFF